MFDSIPPIDQPKQELNPFEKLLQLYDQRL